MSFWNWFMEVYEGEESLIVILTIAAGLLVVAAISAYLLRAIEMFAAFAAIVGGVAVILSFFTNAGTRARYVTFSALLIFDGIVYLFLFGALTARKVVLERKRCRAEIARRLCYTLPDRENSYVRARLNTTLQVPNEALNEYMGGAQLQEKPIKLEYARQLLSKVKEAPLSKAERLQAEEMGKVFSLYLHKEGWTVEDLRAVNDLCAALLKLSAKYAV